VSERLKNLRTTIQEINRYVPGKSIEEIAREYGHSPAEILKLGSNENQLGPSRFAVEAIRQAAGSVHLYPDVDAAPLKRALSEYTGLPEELIVASGGGMDGVLDTLMRMFVREGKDVILPTPTFSYYEISALANGGRPVFVPRGENFAINTDQIIRAADDASLIFLCSPNNPTGNQVSEKDLRGVLESVNALVFLDEAYVEFADKNFIHLVKEYDNLVVGRTFSKAFGLAGLRLGYAVMSEAIQRAYMKVATPFSISRVAEHAGIAALEDREHLKESIEMVRRGRTQLSKRLNLETYPTQASFILAETYPHLASEITTKLLSKGIIIRDCTSFRDAGKYLVRITVGREEQNERVIELLNNMV